MRFAALRSIPLVISVSLSGCIGTNDVVFPLGPAEVAPMQPGYHECVRQDDAANPSRKLTARFVRIQGENPNAAQYLWLDSTDMETKVRPTSNTARPLSVYHVNDDKYVIVEGKNSGPGEFIYPISVRGPSFDYMIYADERIRQVARSFPSVAVKTEKGGFTMSGPIKDQEAFVRKLVSSQAGSIVITHCRFIDPAAEANQ